MFPELFHHLDLLPYQSAFAANTARFKIGLWARQTGKDHTATAEAVWDCLENPGGVWIILAASERQALESLAKAKDWAAILKLDIDNYEEVTGEDSSESASASRSVGQNRLSKAEIRWSNGSRLLALPANPHTIRGYSANLILTEFAFHEDADAIWRAIYPSISNPLRGGLKKLRIISTPNGLNNKFAQLWLNTSPAPCPPSSTVGHSPYFKSKITINDAVADGLPLDPAELRAGLNDDDAWSQEYLCEFMDSSTVMFPYDLITPCESELAAESGFSLQAPNSSLLFAGIDFGRKHHLTVCWIIEAVPARSSPSDGHSLPLGAPWTYVTREVLCLKNTSTPDQIDILKPRLRRCRRIALDYTGAGVGFGDYLVQTFGECRPATLSGRSSGQDSNYPGKIELCQFTPALKSELFPRLRAAFEQRLIRIPASRDIREDLHAIQRTVTQSGQITYRAPQTADGHSDRTTALALALRAATSAPLSGGATSLFVPGRTADLRWARRTSHRAHLAQVAHGRSRFGF